eukprot:14849897-Ditylum_brightwellii.AAC.1
MEKNTAKKTKTNTTKNTATDTTTTITTSTTAMDTMSTTTATVAKMAPPKHQTSATKLSRSRKCKSSNYFIQK